MDRDALQAFLAQPHDAIISTNRVGKGSQLSPVWFVWDGESCDSTRFLSSRRNHNLSEALLERPIQG